MTKKLEALFDLPPSNTQDITVDEAVAFTNENKDIIAQVDEAIDKIDASLPLVKDLDAGDSELDELARLATEKFEDLMDLGMNVDPRFGGPIMQTAGVLLGHAISAKTAKMDKKLKMIQLQLQKAKHDHQVKKDAAKAAPDDDEEPIDGKGMVLDRNALLAQIIENSKKQ